MLRTWKRVFPLSRTFFLSLSRYRRKSTSISRREREEERNPYVCTHTYIYRKERYEKKAASVNWLRKLKPEERAISSFPSADATGRRESRARV